MRSKPLILLPLLALATALVVGGSYLTAHRPSMAAMVVVGLYLSMLTFFFPRAGLVLLLLTMFLSPEGAVASGADRPLTIRGEDVIIVLIMMGWLAQAARTRRQALVRWTPLNAPIFLMAAIIVVSALVNVAAENIPAPSALLYGGKRLEYFVIFFMVVSVLRDWEDAKPVLMTMFVVCLLVSLGALAQYARGGTGTGATSTFGPGRANTLGGFAALMSCLCLGFATGFPTTRVQNAFMAISAMTTVCLLLTYSRGAYVAFPVGLLTIVVLDKSRLTTKYLFWYVGPVLVLVFIAILASHIGGTTLGTGRTKVFVDQVRSLWYILTHGPRADPSLKARLDAWNVALSLFFHHPLIGMGVGSRPMGYYDAHWFRELAETGAAGLLTFLWLQIAAFRLALQEYDKAEGPLKGLALGFMGGQVALWINGFSAENFYTIFTAEPFFFLLGLLMVGHLSRTRDAEAAPAEAEGPPRETRLESPGPPHKGD